jgi:hypothetical protein
MIKTIRIKKPGGGSRLQKVKVMASGKYKFVKNTVKGGVRKTRKAGRRAYTTVKSKPRKKTNKPRTTRKSVAKKSLKSKIFGGTLGKVALGVGAGTLAGYVTSMFVPQFSSIAKPAAAFIAAGPIGLISELVIDQGILGNLGGFLGFNGGGMVAQQEVGGL